MHLRDRGGRYRRGEGNEEFRNRLAKRVGDDLLRRLLLEGRHLVLQRFQIARDLRADYVRPRREELSELYV